MTENQDHDQSYDFPIEQVRLTVPPTDDPTLPVLTFRTWVLGISTCCFLSAMQRFFAYRQQNVYVSTTCVDMLLLAAGKMMARVLPRRIIRVPGTHWKFSLNPGPFNIKEHVLISIFVTSGMSSPVAVEIITLSKVFYHRDIKLLPSVLLLISTQLLGYGFAGIFMKFLVHSPYMWWPGALVSVSYYRALHVQEERKKGQLTRLQFLVMAIISSCAYSIIPYYLFPSITTLSVICWIWKDSITAQQIGSGLHGLGLGSFALDWTTISSTGSPLVVPISVVINMMVGFIVYVYMLIPIAYWKNAYSAKSFPIASSGLFDSKGQVYNISRIMNEKFEFDEDRYNKYSKVYLSVQLPYSYGFTFANLTSSFTQVALFHGRSIWNQLRRAYKVKEEDIHTKLMKENYDSVPQWWFYLVLFSMIGLAILVCEGFKQQLQLSYWGVLLVVTVVLILMLPSGALAATTSFGIPTQELFELMISYLDPGKPIGNMTFKMYGFISMLSALDFTSDFKLGHYLKIPPKSLFLTQVFGTILGSIVNLGVAWWILGSVKNICNPALLPKGSPWTCPGERTTYNSAVTFGVVGPQRMFYPYGMYSGMFIFFVIGLLAPIPVWILSRLYPEKKWIRLVNFPLIFMPGAFMPPLTTLNYSSWFIIAILFNYVVFKKYKGWWAKYNYLLSAGLDTGTALMAILATVALNFEGIYGINWWGLDINDHCPLANCPTAPGIIVEGCPIIQ